MTGAAFIQAMHAEGCDVTPLRLVPGVGFVAAASLDGPLVDAYEVSRGGKDTLVTKALIESADPRLLPAYVLSRLS